MTQKQLILSLIVLNHDSKACRRPFLPRTPLPQLQLCEAVYAHTQIHTHARIPIRADVSGMHLSGPGYLNTEPRVRSDSWGSFRRSQCLCITNSLGRGGGCVYSTSWQMLWGAFRR